MTRLHGLLAVLLLAALCAVPARAADAAPAQAGAAEAAPATTDISPAFRADILAYMRITGGDQIGRTLGQRIAERMKTMDFHTDPDLAPKVRQLVQEELAKGIEAECADDSELTNMLVPLYAQQFTHEDIRGLIAFYGTPLGAKALQGMPEVVFNAMDAGKRYAPTMVRNLFNRLDARLKAENIRLEITSDEQPAETDGKAEAKP